VIGSIRQGYSGGIPPSPARPHPRATRAPPSTPPRAASETQRVTEQTLWGGVGVLAGEGWGRPARGGRGGSPRPARGGRGLRAVASRGPACPKGIGRASVPTSEHTCGRVGLRASEPASERSPSERTCERTIYERASQQASDLRASEPASERFTSGRANKRGQETLQKQCLGKLSPNSLPLRRLAGDFRATTRLSYRSHDTLRWGPTTTARCTDEPKRELPWPLAHTLTNGDLLLRKHLPEILANSGRATVLQMGNPFVAKAESNIPDPQPDVWLREGL